MPLHVHCVALQEGGPQRRCGALGLPLYLQEEEVSSMDTALPPGLGAPSRSALWLH